MRLLRTKQNLIKMQIASSFTIGVKCRFLSQGDKSLPKPFLGLVMAPRTSLEKTLKRLLVRFPPSELLFPLSSASVEFGDTDKLVRLMGASDDVIGGKNNNRALTKCKNALAKLKKLLYWAFSGLHCLGIAVQILNLAGAI